LDLQAQGRPVLPETVGHHQPALLAVAQSGQPAPQEQPHPFRGVGRVGDQQVGPLGRGAGQAEPEVGEQTAHAQPSLFGDLVEIGEDPFVQIDDRDRHRRVDQGHRQRGEVVVAHAQEVGAP
jgi:hypothetical protein